jgi:hypothetical protein
VTAAEQTVQLLLRVRQAGEDAGPFRPRRRAVSACGGAAQARRKYRQGLCRNYSPANGRRPLARAPRSGWSRSGGRRLRQQAVRILSREPALSRTTIYGVGIITCVGIGWLALGLLLLGAVGASDQASRSKAIMSPSSSCWPDVVASRSDATVNVDPRVQLGRWVIGTIAKKCRA